MSLIRSKTSNAPLMRFRRTNLQSYMHGLTGTARRMQRNRARRFLNKGLAYSAVRTMPH